MTVRLNLFFAALCLLLCSGSLFGQTTNKSSDPWPDLISDAPTARRFFIETESIIRMPHEEQLKQLSHVYRDLFVPLDRRVYSMAVEPRFPPKRRHMNVEQTATSVQRNAVGWPALHEAARENCVEILRTNFQTLVPLVKTDLASSDESSVRRGLRAISVFKLNEMFDDLVGLFRKNNGLEIYSAQTLRDLNDSRAIRILIERFPDRPTEFYECLLHLQHGRKADPALLKLLDSSDARVRWQATYALRESGDVALVPVVKKMFNDSEAKVREHAAVIPFNMTEDGFTQLRPDLIHLLKDTDARVRYQTATAFASRKDDVCAEALLGLLQEKGLEDWLYSNVVQSINTLTGFYFGYNLGEPPTTDTNKAAIDRFAQWIKEHRN